MTPPKKNQTKPKRGRFINNMNLTLRTESYPKTPFGLLGQRPSKKGVVNLSKQQRTKISRHFCLLQLKQSFTEKSIKTCLTEETCDTILISKIRKKLGGCISLDGN